MIRYLLPPHFLFTFVAGLLLSSLGQASPVFINEFHYDNAGADRDEFVEVAAPAGTNLDGWSLLFYNGSNGNVYLEWGLSGIVPETYSGWGALSFSGPGSMQNGLSDGIALVNPFDQVFEFLSYEGALTGLSGPAAGLISMDVGVEESSLTPVGFSVQRSGSLGLSLDNQWYVGEHSAGDINLAQRLVNEVPEPGLVLLFFFGLSCLSNSRGLFTRALADGKSWR